MKIYQLKRYWFNWRNTKHNDTKHTSAIGDRVSFEQGQLNVAQA